MKKRIAGVPVAVAVAAVAVTAGVAPAASTHAAAACNVNNEKLTYFPAQGAAGTLFEHFRVKHRGAGSCTLRGYPKVTLLGSGNKVLPIKVKHDHSRKVRTRTIKSGNPTDFLLRHPTADPKTSKPCNITVRHISVLLPGAAKPLVISGFGGAKFCKTGARVTTFLPKQK
jgi:hypothetical protein